MRLFALHRNESGVAAVEFALLAPLLILFFFGVLEVSNLLIADTKIRSVAANISDLITQDSTGGVTVNDLTEASIAAQRIMNPLPANLSGLNTNMAVLVTAYKTEDTGGGPVTTVRWTRLLPNQANAASLGLSTPACSDISDFIPALATTTNDVVRVEAIYRWRPWFASIFTNFIDLRAVNFNMPRYVSYLQPGSDWSLAPCN